jgi:hypothetical protein
MEKGKGDLVIERELLSLSRLQELSEVARFALKGCEAASVEARMTSHLPERLTQRQSIEQGKPGSGSFATDPDV